MDKLSKYGRHVRDNLHSNDFSVPKVVGVGSLRALGGAQVPIFHSGAVTKRGDDLATLTLHDLSSTVQFAFAN